MTIATRISPGQYEFISDKLSNDFVIKYFPDARILQAWTKDSNFGAKEVLDGTVAVMCAGTSDFNIAEESAVLLELSGVAVDRIYDVGVAGIHRLLENVERFRSADVVVVCAGMDGALPSVVAGLTKAPVIAVPTSVGYGASFGGVSALLTMLNSCAPGVTVVNIDNGFGAAVSAYKILKIRK